MYQCLFLWFLSKVPFPLFLLRVSLFVFAKAKWLQLNLTPLDMNILTRKKQAAQWTPMGTLCETIGNQRALSLFSLHSVVWLPVERVSIPWQFQFHFKFHVSRSGVWIPVKIFFRFFSSPNFLPRSINGEYFLKNFIDWLIWVVIGVPSQKVSLTGIRTPDLETWNLKWKWDCHSMLNCSTRSTRSQSSRK